MEAAVSIGGTQVREGINVYRFANRIPLLFETGIYEDSNSKMIWIFFNTFSKDKQSSDVKLSEVKWNEIK